MEKKANRELYEDEDYERAQARLDRIAEPLRAGAESDHLLYQTLESIVLSSEDNEVKEGMVVCLLERFFLRVNSGSRN